MKIGLKSRGNPGHHVMDHMMGNQVYWGCKYTLIRRSPTIINVTGYTTRSTCKSPVIWQLRDIEYGKQWNHFWNGGYWTGMVRQFIPNNGRIIYIFNKSMCNQANCWCTNPLCPDTPSSLHNYRHDLKHQAHFWSPQTHYAQTLFPTSTDMDSPVHNRMNLHWKCSM